MLERPGQPTTPNAKGDAQEMLEALLPWGVSVLAHVALILLAVFAVWTIGSSQEPDAPIGKVTLAPSTTQSLLDPLMDRRAGGGRSSAGPRSLTGIGPRSSPSTLDDIGAAPGRLPGLADQLPPLDHWRPGAGATGRSNMFGPPPAQAKRVVFVIDASGSLIDTLPFVLAHLKRSVHGLQHHQQFTVIFFQGGRIIEAPPGNMRRATDAAKTAVIDWLAHSGIVASGQPAPMEAIARALRYQPDLIYLLSDNITGSGRYELDQARLLAAIDRMNTAGAQINTIQFLYPDPLTRAGRRATLELISQRSGGTYRFIEATELELE